jgi:hypothetical protein
MASGDCCDHGLHRILCDHLHYHARRSERPTDSTSQPCKLMDLLILLVIILLLFGGGYSYNRRADWGYAPVGGLGFILLVIVLLYFFGHHRL